MTSLLTRRRERQSHRWRMGRDQADRRASVDDMILRYPCGLKMALGENPKKRLRRPEEEPDHQDGPGRADSGER